MKVLFISLLATAIVTVHIASGAPSSSSPTSATSSSSQRDAKSLSSPKDAVKERSVRSADASAPPEPSKASTESTSNSQAAPAAPASASSAPAPSSASSTSSSVAPKKSEKDGAKSKSTSGSSSSGKSSSSTRSKSSSSSASTNGVYGFDAWHSIAARHPIMPMKKSDKRHLHPMDPSSSKLGDMFGVVTNNDLTRSIGASVRSLFKSKFSVPAYVASALLGAVALMAFYESPISPLPVPPLPEPPVGRFPPEMPSISPNAQTPFRYAAGQMQNNGYQQQGYQQQQYQRSSNLAPSGPVWSSPSSNPGYPNQQQQQQAQQQAQQDQQLQQQQQPQAQPPTITRKSDVDVPMKLPTSGSGRSLFGGGLTTLGAQSNQRYSANNDGGFALRDLFDLTKSSLDAQRQQSKTYTGGVTQVSSNPTNVLSKTFDYVQKLRHFFSFSPATQSSSAPTRGSATSSANAGANNAAGLSVPANSASGTSQYSAASSAPSSDLMVSGSTPNSVAPAAAPGTTSNSSPTKHSFLYSVMHPLMSIAGAGPSKTSQSSNGGSAASSAGLMGSTDRIMHALLDTISAGIQRHSAANSANSSPFMTVASKSSSDLKSSMLDIGTVLDVGKSSVTVSDSSSASSSPSSSSSMSSAVASSSESTQMASSRSDDTPMIITADQLLSAPLKSSSSSSSTSSSASPSVSTLSSSSSSTSSSDASDSQKDKSLVRKARSVISEYDLGAPVSTPSFGQIEQMVDYVADNYAQNRVIFNALFNHMGLGRAQPILDNLLMARASR